MPHLYKTHHEVDGVPVRELDQLFRPHTELFRDLVKYEREYSQEHNHQLPPIVFTDFITYRRNLHPHQFDLWHHTLGKLLREREYAPTERFCGEVTLCGPATILPPNGLSPCIPSVSEPSTGVLSVMAVLLISWCFSKKGA